MITKPLSLLFAGLIFLSSCVSTTMIQSIPGGANVYLNGEPVGRTPYYHSDTKIVGSTTSVRLEKEGYETLHTSFSRDEEVDAGAIVGGIFVWVPFLWTMKYKPVRTYELQPFHDYEPIDEISTQQNTPVPYTSKAHRLRELKKLLDDGILTQDEFEKEKKKILAEDDY